MRNSVQKMVVSKDAKRKRKEPPPTPSTSAKANNSVVAEATTTTSPEIPKRKVQAQRKFAQGQGPAALLYGGSNLPGTSSALISSSNPVTPNKDPPSEVFTNKRPKTEDFLTYLCFRGTSVLPKNIEFLQPEQEEAKTKSTVKNNRGKSVGAKKIATKKSNKAETFTVTASTSKAQKNNVEESFDIKKEDKTLEIMPFAVRKRAEHTVDGNRRLRNQTSVEKAGTSSRNTSASRKDETSRRSLRNRSKPDLDYNDPDESFIYTIGNDGDDTHIDDGKSEIREEKKPPMGRNNKRKTTTKRATPASSPLVVEEKRSNTPNDRRNANTTPLTGKTTPIPGKSTPTESKARGGRQKREEIISIPEPGGRMTRQRAFFEPVKPPYRDPDPEDVKPDDLAESTVEDEQQADFSSDDEQPLAKAIKLVKKDEKKLPGKGKKKGKMSTEQFKMEPDVQKSQSLENQATVVEPRPLTPETVVLTPSPTTLGGVVKRKPGRKGKKFNKIHTEAERIEEPPSPSESPPEKVPKISTPKGKRKGRGQKQKFDDYEESESAVPKSKIYKKFIDMAGDQSQTDFSEPETRTGRPMRKTKEAATIYMELIGQKLNLDDFDDDNESIDSFPELPNAKQTAKMENELKANAGRSKGKGRGRKKKGNVLEPNGLQTVPKPEKLDQSYGEEEIKKTQLKLDKKFQPGTSKKAWRQEDTHGLLEKSFSDSDDEPLATKLVKPAESLTKDGRLPKTSPPKKLADSFLDGSFATHRTTDSAHVITKLQPPEISKNFIPEARTPLKITPPTTPPSPIRQAPLSKQTNKAESPKLTATQPTFPAVDRFPSPKINPTFLTPKFDRNLERRPQYDPSPTALTMGKMMIPSSASTKADLLFIPSTSASPSDSKKPEKSETDSFLSANLMPSKEESSKIFGIASVTLAQSSGPDNTKCTLGKCGSVHKPVLGPVVPTEAYLGEQMSSKERRKAKVNMTHEQIQKWLLECSSDPDEIPNDLEDDFDEPLKPRSFAPSPIPVKDEKDSSSPSTSSKAGKETNKSENVWSNKGPSLKATPIFMKEELKPPTPVLPDATKPSTPVPKELEKAATKAAKVEKEVSKASKTSPVPAKAAKERIKSPKPATKNVASPKTAGTTTKGPRKTNASPDTPKKAAAKTVVTPPPPPPPQQVAVEKKTPPPSKPIKRHTVYGTKINEAKRRAHAANTSTFSTFATGNTADNSVYNFDKEEDDLPPVTKPFRRQSRRDSTTHEENSQGEKSSKKTDKTPTKDPQQNNSVSLTLSPEDNNKSVKVALDAATEKALRNEKAAAHNDTQGDSDSEGHTFYIPLQAAAAGNVGSKSSDIQGVAVKLGREGPEGPNQRVIMHATLVTKAQMGTNSTPLPDSMNVHEIVKSLISSNKESTGSNSVAGGSKSVPVGTVQPRFKSNDSTQNASGSGLQRVNSNSSLFSGSAKSRAASTGAKKQKDEIPVKMCNNTAFPHRDDPAQMVEAPIFKPTEKEFQDPIEFIERITPIAARFGICKIIPPDSFKPECRISDDMRFNAYNQYVHKMLHRWGPSAKELSAIRKYLATQSIAMVHPPWIGGMEVDLPRLYHTVQEQGGLKEVIEKKKWARVAEEMCIPKLAQDRCTKLDDIYCKFLLPYDTLSPAERQKLFDEVEADWAKREARARRNADRCINPESVSNEDDEASSEDDDESDEEIDGVSMECIVKGRSMALSAFFRIARNTMALWFKNTEPNAADIEAEFWRHVAVRDSHVCVHSGSIDSSGWGYGFPTPGPKTKGSLCSRHPWNLKVLTNNPGSVLRSLGPVTGVTVPTLHVGMLFSACCWYRDPHGLSWIEYLHTGASKIWYGIPDEQSSSFRGALSALIPTHCQNKTIWLPCDTAMVPPHMLTDRSVSLCRIEQKPGEFVVIFPRAYTSSVATGYVVSESVYFATSSWLDSSKEDFKDIHESCEPAMFSLEQLLFALSSDQRVTTGILSQILPMLTDVYDKEIAAREQLKAAGVNSTEKLPPPNAKSKQKFHPSEEHECDLCRANIYISMIKTDDGNVYCLQHALKNINNGNVQAKQCKLIFTYNIEDVENLLKNLRDRLTQMPKKKSSGANSGRKGSQNK